METLSKKKGGSDGLKMFCGTEQVLASLLLRGNLHERQRNNLQGTEEETADSGGAPRKVQSGTEPLGSGGGGRAKDSEEEEATCGGPQRNSEEDAGRGEQVKDAA